MSYNVTEQDERKARDQTQKKLETIVPRELLPNGSYSPVPGIFDVAWKGLNDLPYFDFVKEMRQLDNGIIKDGGSWLSGLGDLYLKKELTLDQIRRYELHSFKFVDIYPISIIQNVFQNLQNREVRDLIIRHAGEEMGHSELEADFLEFGMGMTRQEIWDAPPLVQNYVTQGAESEDMTALRKESPELAYALVPFCERVVPNSTRLQGKGLREQYGLKDDVLGFFDLHTYIDIYHERFGAYIMAKYARSKRLQDIFHSALLERREILKDSVQAAYYALKLK